MREWRREQMEMGWQLMRSHGGGRTPAREGGRGAFVNGLHPTSHLKENFYQRVRWYALFHADSDRSQ